MPVGTPLAIIREDGAAVAAPAAAAAATADAAGGGGTAARLAVGAPPRRRARGRPRRVSRAPGPAAASSATTSRRLPRQPAAPAASRGTVAAPAPRRSRPARRPRQRRGRRRTGRRAAGAMRRAIAAAMARSKREIPHYYRRRDDRPQRRHAPGSPRRTSRRSVDRRLLVRRPPHQGGRARPARGAGAERDLAGRAGSSRPTRSTSARDLAARRRPRRARAPRRRHAARLDELMRRASATSSRAPAPGSCASSEISDPTITVTSLGERGRRERLPDHLPAAGRDRRLRQGRRAAVGLGRAAPRLPARRPRRSPADHRVTDGHRAGAFLAAVDRLLQEPEAL